MVAPRGNSPPQDSRARGPARTDVPALALLAIAMTALAFVVFARHPVPGYGVETDLLGDLIPAARAIRSFTAGASHFQFKGPGYPLMLALAGALTGGDDWLAARLLGLVAAAAGSWCAFRIARRFLDAGAARFVMLALFANAVWLAAAVEAGTDMPAFALSLAATDLALGARGRRGAALGGLLAGLATLTRYNAAFLVPAAMVALARREDATASRPARIAAHLAGFALPVAAWAVIAPRLHGGPWHDLNFLNIAYALYGQRMAWDDYWPSAARAFHSLGDVIRFDPARAGWMLLVHLATRWWLDVQRLLPAWAGFPALAGMLLVWPRRRGALALAAHPLAAYLVLATVFYNPRFFLYLVPFYLIGLAALLFHFPWPRPAAARTAPRGSAAAAAIPLTRIVAWPVALVVLAVTGVTAVRQVATTLAGAPLETRIAGEALRSAGVATDAVMARKPQVAYFAGMRWTPIPPQGSLAELLDAARAQGVRYLFFSRIEASLRPRLIALADPGFALPGLVHLPAPPAGAPYALYRFTGERVAPEAFADTLARAMLALARRRDDALVMQWSAATTLIELDRPADALAVLERIERLAPGAPENAVLEAAIRMRTGETALGLAAALRALEARWVPRGLLTMTGAMLIARGDLANARLALERAVERDPLDAGAWLRLAVVARDLRDDAAADRALVRCEAAAPELRAACDSVRAAYAPGGAPARALALARALPPPELDLAALMTRVAR